MTPADLRAPRGESESSWQAAAPADLVWRPLTSDDLPGLAGLVAMCEEHDDPPYRTTPGELVEDVLDATGAAPDSATLGGFDGEDHLVAYGRIRVSGTRTAPRLTIGGGVLPARRRQGIGAAVLGWQLETARRFRASRERAVGSPVAVRLVTYVEDGMTDQSELLGEAGFAPARYYTEMRRDLAQPVPQGELIASLTLEPWHPELDDQVRLAHNDAFADHDETEPQTPQMWREGASHVAPEWSFLVMDRSTDRTRIAGYLISGRYEQDWPALGFRAGYTDLLGVRREWRGRGIATALLSAAMRAYAADGMEYACLGVDSATDDGAFGLYERLGYAAARGSSLWALDLTH